MRVLALAAATDMGSNTPIEFLLENTGIELMMLHVIPEAELPSPLPDHDVAIVIASDSEDCQHALRKIDEVAARWPRPLLNPPQLICNLDRDKLYRLLADIDGLVMPATFPAQRAPLVEIAEERELAADDRRRSRIPDHHPAARLACRRRSRRRSTTPSSCRFISTSGTSRSSSSRASSTTRARTACFANTASSSSTASPMPATWRSPSRWDIWYLNAGMAASEEKRREEATFMQTFDIGFGRRHRTALAAIAERVGLDYFIIDCAETKDGALLVFEADNTAVVHDMDHADIFPYKSPQMQKVFSAFAAMLERRAAQAREQAA